MIDENDENDDDGSGSALRRPGLHSVGPGVLEHGGVVTPGRGRHHHVLLAVVHAQAGLRGPVLSLVTPHARKGRRDLVIPLVTRNPSMSLLSL